MKNILSLILTGVLALSYCASAADNAAAAPAPAEEESLLMGLWKSTGLYGFLCGDKVAEDHHVAEDKAKMARQDKLKDAVNSVTNAENARELDKTLDKLNPVKKAPLFLPKGAANFVMILVCLLLIYLAIHRGYEPLLLLPIGFGGLLANIPLAGVADPGIGNAAGGFLYQIYIMGVESGLFPLLIFMGVGAMTDFGPLIANPKTALLGGAAQLGIFSTVIGAVLLYKYGICDFGAKDITEALKAAASIGIIGGADGPTSIFVASRLYPDLLGAIAVAAYSYMALVPIIQPPIMRALVPENERKIEMKQLRHVSKTEKIIFPLLVLLLCAVLLPDACPLIGALMFGNLCKVCGMVDRIANCMQNELINIVTIFLGLSVGSKLSADKFLTLSTLGILFLGLLAFSVGTAGGVLLARLMSKLSKEPINPLIGAAGVSAVPMAARVVNGVGLESNPQNFLLMHAMGPNVAGVIGSAVAAGILLSQLNH